MKKLLLAVVLVFPVLGFSFSETELDSLSSSGTKSLSPKPYRLELGASLQRNLEFNSLLGESSMLSVFDPKKDSSLFDLSNLYYGLSLKLNYSLSSWDKAPFKFIKNIELYASTGFRSPFTGYKNDLLNYNAKDYVQYAIRDLWLGLSFPTFKKEKVLSWTSFSFIVWPLNRFSREATLISSLDASISFLYFLIKKPDWNLSLSSGHGLAYHYFKNKSADSSGTQKNIPLDTTQSLSLIYRQSYSRFVPSNVSFYSSHYLGVNTYKTWLYDLAVGSSASWQIQKGLYFKFSIGWKDRVWRYNKDKEVTPATPYFNLSRIVTSFGFNYAF